MSRRRFVAPSRADVPASRFLHPVFSTLEGHRRFLGGNDWPALADLDAAWVEVPQADWGPASPRLRFVAQDEALLGDGLHYETRIRERGDIATRPENWHDLFNALAWLRYPRLKSALNRRQAADVARLGPRRRSRGQEAMTQFDEAGCVLLLRDPALLALWDAHDWTGLFWRQRPAWSDGRIEWAVFGHALFEHALVPELLLVGKCLVVSGADGGTDIADAVAAVASGVAVGTLLQDPSELRPLPLSGIPGWHPDSMFASFYGSAPCFRPARPGRRYPLPLRL